MITEDKEQKEMDDEILYKDYWLAEIKSQEDSARQIISISIILLGLSITLFSSYCSQLRLQIISLLIDYNKASEIAQPIINKGGIIYIIPLMYAAQFFLLFSSAFIWIMAIDTARRAIKLESADALKFKEIASIKNKHISHTIKILIWGTMGLALLIFAFTNYPFSAYTISPELNILDSVDFFGIFHIFIWIIALFLWIICVIKAFSYWQMK